MPRRVLTSLLFAGLLACGDTTPSGGTDAAPDNVPLCTASLTVTGTFTPAAAVDPTMGCQPAGAWAVQVATADKGNCTTVKTNATYNYTVSMQAGSARSTAVQYTAAAGETDTLTIGGDNGECRGNFDHVLTDGSQFDEIVLHPTTPPFASGPADASPRALTGSGTYNLWATQP